MPSPGYSQIGLHLWFLSNSSDTKVRQWRASLPFISGLFFFSFYQLNFIETNSIDSTEATPFDCSGLTKGSLRVREKLNKLNTDQRKSKNTTSLKRNRGRACRYSLPYATVRFLLSLLGINFLLFWWNGLRNCDMFFFLRCSNVTLFLFCNVDSRWIRASLRTELRHALSILSRLWTCLKRLRDILMKREAEGHASFFAIACFTGCLF